jgi:hypothetical protein
MRVVTVVRVGSLLPAPTVEPREMTICPALNLGMREILGQRDIHRPHP